ncbi:WhiB family transcriptional regulator [Pseudactinotalea sp. Z1748]|uniref:WhiB family transcriptional regulator n=1 Tax=Pseudactinotalea sp. Z1748 TaxID=3413027 RepID=UPI003C7ED057
MTVPSGRASGIGQERNSGTVQRLDALARPARDDRVLPCQDPAHLYLWFAEGGHEVERAKELCQECPIKQACLRGAMDRGEPWGVWGGEVFVDGEIVARKRGRGRPRKDESHAPSRRRTQAA